MIIIYSSIKLAIYFTWFIWKLKYYLIRQYIKRSFSANLFVALRFTECFHPCFCLKKNSVLLCSLIYSTWIAYIPRITSYIKAKLNKWDDHMSIRTLINLDKQRMYYSTLFWSLNNNSVYITGCYINMDGHNHILRINQSDASPWVCRYSLKHIGPKSYRNTIANNIVLNVNVSYRNDNVRTSISLPTLYLFVHLIYWASLL